MAMNPGLPAEADLIHPTGPLESEYWNMRREAAVYRLDRGLLRLTGGESRDFLQRLSTNDVSTLDKDTPVRSVLTNQKGRVIDLCTLIHWEGGVLIMTSPGQAATVAAWLQKYIIMEDIIVDDLSAVATTALLIGPHAQPRASALMGLAGISFLGTHGNPLVESGGQIIVEEPNASIPCFCVIAERKRINNLFFTSDAIPSIGDEAYVTFCIEEGIPRNGVDYSADSNPLEAGLRSFVSFTKGCYIGQEVIARIDTYSKLQKELQGLLIDAEEKDPPLLPGDLWADDEVVGRTTSHAWSFGLNRRVALGYVRTGTPSGKLRYRAGGADGGVPAHIRPFPLSRGTAS